MLKKIITSIGAASILILLLVVTVPFFLDVNAYKEDILAFAKEKTGKQVAIDGPIELTLLPKVTLTIKDASYSDSMDSGDINVAISTMDVRLKLWPLFKGKFEIDSFFVQNPKITIVPTIIDETEKKSKEKKVIVVEDKGQKIQQIQEQLRAQKMSQKQQEFLSVLRLSDVTIENAQFENKISDVLINNINLKTSYIYQKSNPFDLTGSVPSLQDKGNFVVKGTYKVEQNYYGIENTAIKMGNMDFFGNISVDVNALIPEINFSFNSDSLDLTPYLDPAVVTETNIAVDDEQKEALEAVKAQTVSDAQEESFKWSEEPIDFSVLKEFDGHINVKLKQLKLREYELNNVLFNAYLKSGKLSSKVKELSLYGGNTLIKSEIDVNEEEPSVSLNVAVEGLDAALLPNKVTFLGSITGKVNTGLDIVTSGSSIKDFVARSAGSAKFNVDGGRFEGVDLLSMANNVAKAFNIYEDGLDSSTDFERVSGTFEIKDGIVKGKDFLIENQSVHFHGAGKLDLPKLRVDYKLTPKLAPEKEDIGIKLPIIIRGDLFKPVFRLEVESVVRDVLKNPEQKGKKIIKQIKRELQNIEGEDTPKEKKPLDALKNIINKNILSIF